MKKLLILTLCAAFVGTALSGCASKGGGGTNSSVAVWSTYSTAKVTKNVKDSVPYEKLGASVDVEMAKNETEGAQIIMTAEDKSVKSYKLTVNDLTSDDGNVLPKSAISVYAQKYLVVNRKTDIYNTDYAVGDAVPDMLLPHDISVEYGENKIKKGENQGLTIEFTTTPDTAAGVYVGNFTLDVDGKKQDIPVKVTVWDFAYEGRRTFQSSFLIYRNMLMAGEYEASDELVKRYEEFLLKYKMNCYVIKHSDEYSVDELVAEAIEFSKNDNYNSISIPRYMKQGYSATDKMADEIADFITGIAKASSPENPYVDYLYIYPTYFDEADQHENTYADVEKVFKNGGEWDKTLQKALDKITATAEYKAMSEEFKEHVRSAVLDIPAVFTNVTFREDWVKDSRATFCPYLSLLGDDATLAKYAEAAENVGGNLWAYTCIKPNYPDPTFHIDDYNLGTRISGWMEKKFGVNGYLYWAVNTYQAINEDEWRYVNPYETAERASYCAGDGYLVYPGAYYGSEYPFPSVRLTAYRDSMDDYDALCVYENILSDAAEYYGKEFALSDFVTDLYDDLFAGTSYYTDDALLFETKRELANRIEVAKNPDKLIVKRGYNAITVYSSAASLNVDGTAVAGTASGNGYVYEITSDGKKSVRLQTENGAYEYDFVNSKTITLTSDVVTVTDRSEVSVDEGKANVKIVSVYRSQNGKIDGATVRYNPYVEFAASDLVGARGIDFVITNNGTKSVEFTVKTVSDGTASTAGTVYLKAGETRKIHITLDAGFFDDEYLSGVTAIRFAFTNVNADGDALESDRNFTVDGLTVVKGA